MSDISAGEKNQLEKKGTIEPLGADQEKALELLLSGRSMAETALSAGVSRATLYRWLKHDAAFQAAYNRWHNEMRESCRSRLMTLTDKATDAIEKALEAGDAKSALQLLKGMGIIRDEPAGLTDPADVKLAAELEVKKRKSGLARQERMLEYDDRMGRMGMM